MPPRAFETTFRLRREKQEGRKLARISAKSSGRHSHLVGIGVHVVGLVEQNTGGLGEAGGEGRKVSC